MIFSLLKDDDEKSRALIETFLLENEATCVSLVSRFLKKDAKIYLAKEKDKIYAVFSFSAGRQLLFQVKKDLSSDEKEILRIAVGKAFESYFSRAYSIMGTLAECNVISKIAQNHFVKNPVHAQEYNLMIFDENSHADFSDADENDISIKCCGISDFDNLFPLQKSYELEEVVFSPQDFNQNLSELALKKNLAQKKIFALEQNGKFISKLAINARGKNCVQLGGIFTVPELRKRGFAKKLLLSFCKKYCERGKKTVLFVKKTNLAANELYKRCGFRKIDEYKIIYF